MRIRSASWLVLMLFAFSTGATAEPDFSLPFKSKSEETAKIVAVSRLGDPSERKLVYIELQRARIERDILLRRMQPTEAFQYRNQEMEKAREFVNGSSYVNSFLGTGMRDAFNIAGTLSLKLVPKESMDKYINDSLKLLDTPGQAPQIDDRLTVQVMTWILEAAKDPSNPLFQQARSDLQEFAHIDPSGTYDFLPGVPELIEQQRLEKLMVTWRARRRMGNK
jgi:hypothetical protein